MASPRETSPRQAQSPSGSGPPPQSIPLRNLQRPPDEQNPNNGGRGDMGLTVGGHSRAQQSPERTVGHQRRLSPTTVQTAGHVPGISTYWEHPHTYSAQHDDGSVGAESPIDPMALQFALPPDIRVQHAPATTPLGSAFSASTESPYGPPTPYYEEGPDSDSIESDRVPLKPAAPPFGRHATNESDPAQRDSFQTVRDLDNSPSRSRPQNTQMLGFGLDPAAAGARRPSYGNALTPDGGQRPRATSTSGALSRASSMMRAMSQRVVMISGEGDLIDQQARRERSVSPTAEDRRQQASAPMLVDTSYPSQVFQATPMEKAGAMDYMAVEEPPPPPPRFLSRPRDPLPNPLKGNSLGIFAPDNRLRLWLCDLLVNPWTEPLILSLIILQAVLLAIESAPDVFLKGNERPERWAHTRIDWAILGLFVIFTVELFARIIVSGFIVNAPEYTTGNRNRGVRERAADQYRQIFKPQRQKSVKAPRQESFAPTFARSFTVMQGNALPETLEEQQRLHLARRAFLRHGFNRLDFVAIVSFWISFVLGVTGLEMRHHLFIFRMLSCLRILRLLALTKGNAIILRSLKKAAPLLVRVSFLIGFFWLLFAIIGVQSFKSSLNRQCLWRDPQDPTNINATYKQDTNFCGGHLDNGTGQALPWVRFRPGQQGNLSALEKGTSGPKGFLCPRGSICLQQGNPYNGTVHFDDIVHSLSLVFVIMSANTFSDLMYYTTNSDYLPTALFFGAGIMIMMLWMTNLMIAVITSSFQVIREESKSSAFTAEQDPVKPLHVEDHPRRVSALQRVYNKTSWVWVVVITFGMICQSVRSASMLPFREQFINSAEIAVTLALDVEILIRLIADFRGFHRKLANLVDLGLAVITSIILIPPIRNSGQVYAWLTVFQILRSYRIVLAIPMTRKLIQLVLGNVTGIGNLMLFVFLITFLMAIFAAQLFRGEISQLDATGNRIKITFNTIFNSFLGMYQVLTSENWTEILYHVTAFTTRFQTAWVGAMFLVGWFILSFFILINMFIAVIQENFDVGEDTKRLEQVRAFLQRKELGGAGSNMALSKVFALGKTRKRKDPLDYGPATMEMLLKEAVVQEFLDETMDNPQEARDGSMSPPQRLISGATFKTGPLSTVWERLVSAVSSREPNPFYSSHRFDGPNETMDPRQMARQAVSATAARRKAQREYLARHPTYNTSLFIFKPKNPIRRLCQQLVGPSRGSERFDGVEPNKYAWYAFSAVVYAAIVAMVVLACVTTPLYQKEYFTTHDFSILNWFVWTDLAFAVVFTLEAMIKVVADGYFWTPNAYFRSAWGIIDGVVLITLWINVITLFTSDGAVSRAVGAFKALRALRLLNVSDSARQTFHSLIFVVGWKILSAAFVSFCLLIPFAVYGLNLFNGKMMSCNDTSLTDSLNGCFGEWNSTPFSNDWNLLSPRVADNPYFNFDDFGSALFILFQIVSQEGWVDVSFAAQAITGTRTQPQPSASQGNALFFVIFNLMATVFVLTLFISVFMRTYTEQTGVAFLTAEQRSWLELRKLLRQISPSKSSYDESKNKWKMWCHKRAIEKRGKWYTAVTCVLVLHLLLLLSEFLNEPEQWTMTRDSIFLFFIVIYIVNIGIRIVGLGWARFRRSSWDIYSLIAVTGAFATSLLFLSNTRFDTYIQLHKFFLVAIVLLLIPRNDALDQLFKTAAASLTTIGNLIATWLVFFLVFAIALTQTFSLTRFGQNESNNINLRTVPNAMILLFRMSCGEGWNQLMEDYAQITPPMCVESTAFFKSDCGSTAWARVLFVAWNIISMYIFVNLFVSLIYESFSYVYQRTAGLAVVDRDEIRRFKEAWRSVDPAGTGFITKEAFPRLLGELSGVFEMRIYDAEDSVRQILEDVRSNSSSNAARHISVASTSQLSNSGIDLKKLNERLAQIDVVKVRERRRRFNIFFEEVMVSADPDKGISFTTVLMILAHYNIISDSKSLRLEEFLRRRARLQRVEEEVRRRVVLGFFDTLYWSRQFKRHMEIKRAGRMTAIPEFNVPEILVEDEDARANRQAVSPGGSNSARARGFGSFPITPATPGTFLTAEPGYHQDPYGSSGTVDYESPFPYGGHPLGAPPTEHTDGSGAHRRAHHASAFSFDLHESLGDGAGSQRSSRAGSERAAGTGTGGVSPAQVREMLDDSAWMDSIRRSATINRRSDWGGYGGGGAASGGGEGAGAGTGQWH